MPERMMQDFFFTNALEKLIRSGLHNYFFVVPAKLKKHSDPTIIKHLALSIAELLIFSGKTIERRRRSGCEIESTLSMLFLWVQGAEK